MKYQGVKNSTLVTRLWDGISDRGGIPDRGDMIPDRGGIPDKGDGIPDREMEYQIGDPVSINKVLYE